MVKKNFVKKISWSKKFFREKLLVKQNSWSKKILVKKVFAHKKILFKKLFWLKKILVQDVLGICQKKMGRVNPWGIFKGWVKKTSSFVLFIYLPHIGLEIPNWTFFNSPFHVDFKNIRFCISWSNLDLAFGKILQGGHFKNPHFLVIVE